MGRGERANCNLSQPRGSPQKLLVQVKSGHVKAGDIRDLRGTVEREGATIGVYVTLEPPSKPMRDEASAAGVYQSKLFLGVLYPKMQIITIKELLEGKMPAYPQMMAPQAFKKAQSKEEKVEQIKLF
jgi:site-specific DNA-methyltransferase (adenine-specific)